MLFRSYGLLLAWRTSGDERYLKLHRQVHDWSWAHLRDETFGEWFGYLDRQGRPTQEAKGGAYKGFFHLPRALLYSLRLLTNER